MKVHFLTQTKTVLCNLPTFLPFVKNHCKNIEKVWVNWVSKFVTNKCCYISPSSRSSPLKSERKRISISTFSALVMLASASISNPYTSSACEKHYYYPWMNFSTFVAAFQGYVSFHVVLACCNRWDCVVIPIDDWRNDLVSLRDQ